MADALRVNVRERAEQLVDVEFHLEDRHDGLHLVEVARGAVDGLGNEFEYEVEVDFVLLRLKRLATWAATVAVACRHIPARHCCRRRP